MSRPLLSITIPTYNRRKFLEELLNILLPQVTEEVEIKIFDNCSEDDTQKYVENLGGSVGYFRQENNIGADRNMVSCLNEVQGEYVWLLCDDDLPCSNTVANMIEAIKQFPDIPMVYLRVIVSDKNVSNYDCAPVKTDWTRVDADGFLKEIGCWFSFASSIVVKRSSLDHAFITDQIGTSLVPGAITLSTVGRHQGALLSKRPLLYMRADNSGGYSALTVFSKNIVHLLRRCDRKWFSSSVINETYNDNLAQPLLVAIRSWPLSLTGLVTLLRYSYRYPNLYKVLVPAFLRRIKNHFGIRFGRISKSC